MNEVGYVLWHSLNERGEVNYYDIEWPSGFVETNIPARLLEKVKDSKDLDEVHEGHGVDGHEEGLALHERKRKKRKSKKKKSKTTMVKKVKKPRRRKHWYLGGYGHHHDHDHHDFDFSGYDFGSGGDFGGGDGGGGE